MTRIAEPWPHLAHRDRSATTSPVELLALSRLLDEALDLPSVDARMAWLHSLGLQHGPLKAQLARLLSLPPEAVALIDRGPTL
ncbi:MAG: hypothetical protein JNJ89_00450 [Rubrivivax sp.]|nr:hypothetical protein [Rubrivivax sp.]